MGGLGELGEVSFNPVGDSCIAWQYDMPLFCCVVLVAESLIACSESFLKTVKINATITDCRPTHGTMRKRHRAQTATAHY